MSAAADCPPHEEDAIDAVPVGHHILRGLCRSASIDLVANPFQFFDQIILFNEAFVVLPEELPLKRP